MNDGHAERIIRLLEEIRDGQKLHLERQAEALDRQTEAIEMQRARMASLTKVDATQQRADQILNKAAGLAGSARLVAYVVVPVAVLLLVLVCWLAFGHAVH
jgi:hypothetical protein